MVVQDTNGDALCSVCGRKFRPKYLNDSSHNCVKNGVHYPGRVCPTCWNKREICPICGENVHPDYIDHIIATVVGGIPQQPVTSANEQIDTEEEELMNLTREDVEAMLIKLYSSDVYNRLVARREHKAFLELFGKARWENGNSSFLVWLFGHEQLNKIAIPPILHLLRLIAFRSSPDNENDPPKLDSELRDQILMNRIKIIDVEVNGENVTTQGRADIKITIAYKILNGISKSSGDTSDSAPQKLILIIENKIDSKEGDKQTERYEKDYTEEAEESNSKVAFVFLSVTKPEELTGKKFIKITHQDILDRVLQPLLVHSSQFSTEILRYIEAYIDSITSFNPDDKKPPIAMDESLRNLLIAFFDENESLIKAVAEAKRQADPNYGTLANDLNNFSKGRSTETYKLIYINNDGESVETETFGMSKALLYYAQTMLKLDSSLTNRLKDILPEKVFDKALLTCSDYEQKKKEFFEKKENENKKYNWYEPIAETDWYVHTGMWKLPYFNKLVAIVKEKGKDYEMEIVKC